MADVEALELQIRGNASGATKSLNALIRTLEKLEKVTAGGCGLSAVSKELESLEKVALNGCGLSAVSQEMKEIKTATADGLGLSKVTKELNNLKKTTAAGAGLSKVTSELGKLKNLNLGASSTNLSSALSFGKMATKVTIAYHSLNRIGNVISSWIDESTGYVENLNLFTVAMGEYADSALEYANTVSEVMGIDPSAWIRNQGVFMTLATGFGVTSDRAATMSQQLTQLGYDISSFYNVSVEDAMQKLQSGISGELEPLRRLGYDLSQAKLEATALSLGIDKSVTSMTQAEKAQLRYYAIMNQVTTAQGDMARTLDAPANQMRIFQAQVEQAARALGNIFIPILNAILPYAIAAAKVIRHLANAIASLFGFSLPEIDYSGVSSLGESAGDASESIDKAAGSAAKLKKILLGIDELNVLPDPSSSGGSGADVGAGGGFDFELPTYDFLGEATNSRINQIVEEMKEWLGITEDIESWSDLMDTRFGSILKTVGLIGIAIGSWKIGAGIAGFVSLIQNSAIGKVIADIAFAIGAVAAKAATLGEAITYVFGGATGIIGGIGLAISGLVGYIANLISMLREGESVTNVLGAALGGLAASAGAFLIAIGVGATIATGGIAAAVVAAVAGVGMLIAVIINHWEEIKTAIAGAYNWFRTTILAPIGEWFAGVATWFYNNVITPIVNFFVPVKQAIVDMVVLIYNKVKEIVTGIMTAIGSVFSKVTEIFLKIVEIAVALGKAFNTYVIQPVANAIAGAATWLYDKAIKPVINFFAKVGTWVYDTIITPVIKGIEWLRDKAIGLFTAIGTTVVNFVSGAFKSVINGVLYGIESTINGFIYMLNGAINLINKIPGVSITKVSTMYIPRLAEGGMVNEGQMFIAREAGPEMVGSIGNRTAVVNNDQIVESVSQGVYQAVVHAMAESGNNQIIEAKVNDQVLFDVIVGRNRREMMRTGSSPLLGGV